MLKQTDIKEEMRRERRGGKNEERREKEGWKRRDRRKTEVGVGKEERDAVGRDGQKSSKRKASCENERRGRRKGRASAEGREKST